jgi:hypothetical protein
LAAHAALRAAITPAGRGAGARGRVAAPPRLVAEEARMSWERRLKRVFGIEIKQRVRCGGGLKVIASIEEPELIERILAHRREQGGEETLTAARAPPRAPLFGFVIVDRIACFSSQETGDVARGTAARGFRPSNVLELGAKAASNRLNTARAAATLTERA